MTKDTKTTTAWIFFVSAALLLIISGVAKTISAFGSSPILAGPDPVLAVPFRFSFLLAAAAEFLIASVFLFSKSTLISASLGSWLTTVFVVYRVFLNLTGYREPCKCLGLGEFTGALRITAHQADTIMKGVLLYILIGCYLFLLGHILKRDFSKAQQRTAQSL